MPKHDVLRVVRDLGEQAKTMALRASTENVSRTPGNTQWVNKGLLEWEATRAKWKQKTNESVGKREVKKPIPPDQIEAAVHHLLTSPKPLRSSIPLTSLVNVLVELWSYDCSE